MDVRTRELNLPNAPMWYIGLLFRDTLLPTTICREEPCFAEEEEVVEGVEEEVFTLALPVPVLSFVSLLTG